jgi:hypothetical protein
MRKTENAPVSESDFEKSKIKSLIPIHFIERLPPSRAVAAGNITAILMLKPTLSERMQALQRSPAPHGSLTQP